MHSPRLLGRHEKAQKVTKILWGVLEKYHWARLDARWLGKGEHVLEYERLLHQNTFVNLEAHPARYKNNRSILVP